MARTRWQSLITQHLHDVLVEVFTYMYLSDGQLENLLVPLQISFHTEESHWSPCAINLNTPEWNDQARIGLSM